MAGYHDEQESINTAKHIWHSGGKWLVGALVAGALGYVGYVAYQGRVHQGSAQAAQLASQVKGDAAKLAALQPARHGNHAGELANGGVVVPSR